MKTVLIFGSCLLADDYKGETYKYVSDYSNICGYKDCEIIMLFESWRKPDRDEIDKYCKSHNIKQIFTR